MTFPNLLLPAFLCLLLALSAAGEPAAPLPFDPQTISRLSVDGLPRSLAVRQGADVWLGYDLERAVVFKCWQAPEGRPGLIRKEFTTQSAGRILCEGGKDSAWRLRRAGGTVPLTIRYLGCSDRRDHIELRWELRHAAGALILHEKVPLAAAPAGHATRELRVEALAAGEALMPPGLTAAGWRLTTMEGAAAQEITSPGWHRMHLP